MAIITRPQTLWRHFILPIIFGTVPFPVVRPSRPLRSVATVPPPPPPSHATGCNLGRHLPCFGRPSPWLMRLLSTDSAAALGRGGEERRRTPWCGSCCNRQAPTRRHLPLAVMRNLLKLFCSGARFSKLLEKILKSYENDRTYEDLRKKWRLCWFSKLLKKILGNAKKA